MPPSASTPTLPVPDTPLLIEGTDCRFICGGLEQITPAVIIEVEDEDDADTVCQGDIDNKVIGLYAQPFLVFTKLVVE